MLGVVQDSAGEKLFWATTGAFAYHWVAVGASGVVQKQRGLAQKYEVSTNHKGWKKLQFLRVFGRRAAQYSCLGACGLRCFGHAGKGAHCHGILGSRNRSR